MKGQRRRKVEWRRGEIDPSHAYMPGSSFSVCGIRGPMTWTPKPQGEVRQLRLGTEETVVIEIVEIRRRDGTLLYKAVVPPYQAIFLDGVLAQIRGDYVIERYAAGQSRFDRAKDVTPKVYLLETHDG